MIVSLLLSLLVDLASSVTFFCALFPLMRLWLLVMLSLPSLLSAPLGFSLSTLLSSVSALCFDVGRVVAFCSLFVAERRGVESVETAV